jgi:hypothetical protein
MVCKGNFADETTCSHGYVIFMMKLTLVPYATKKDFPITPEYTVPKGIVFLGYLYRLHDYPNAMALSS